MSARCVVSESSNLLTDGLWELYAPHRSRLTALLEEQHRRVFGDTDSLTRPWAPQGTLCLLGAGNSNDVALPRLLRKFETAILVDIDHAALSRGVDRQFSSAPGTRVELHGGIDLFGFDATEKVSDGEQAAELFSRDRVGATLRSLLKNRCDVVSAAGLLSQLVRPPSHHPANLPTWR